MSNMTKIYTDMQLSTSQNGGCVQIKDSDTDVVLIEMTLAAAEIVTTDLERETEYGRREELHEKTNPETCLHNIVQMPIAKDNLPYLDYVCISCDSTLSKEFEETKNYIYDIDYNVWVHHYSKKV